MIAFRLWRGCIWTKQRWFGMAMLSLVKMLSACSSSLFPPASLQCIVSTASLCMVCKLRLHLLCVFIFWISFCINKILYTCELNVNLILFHIFFNRTSNSGPNYFVGGYIWLCEVSLKETNRDTSTRISY